MRCLLILLALVSPCAIAAPATGDALAAFDRRDFAASASLLKTILKSNPSDQEILYLLARSQYKAGDNSEAEETLARLLKQDDRHVEALYLLGIVSLALVNEVSIFRKLGFAQSALDAWQQAIDADPSHVRSQYALFSYYANAPGFAGGDMDKAAARLTAISNLSKPYAAMATATLLLKREDFAAAEPFLVEAADNIRDGAFPLYALANYYADHGKFGEAEATLARFRAAKREWQDPNEAAEYFLEGKIQAGKSEPALARAAYQRALGSGPPAPLADQIKARLKAL